MKLYNLIKAAYSDDYKTFIDYLNQSIYSTNFNESQNSLVIHTGISFLIQTSKELEILYDLKTNCIIRQPRNSGRGLSLPKIHGIQVTKTQLDDNSKPNLNYFNNVKTMVIYSYDFTGELKITILIVNENFVKKSFDNPGIAEITGKPFRGKSKRTIKNIKYIFKIKNKIIRESFPFNKTLKEKIFYYNDNFKSIEASLKDDYFSDNYYDEDE
jgi:hypothetical protein